MSAKLIRRILLAAMGVLFFGLAAHRYAQTSGLTTDSALLGGFGALAVLLAATGKG